MSLIDTNSRPATTNRTSRSNTYPTSNSEMTDPTSLLTIKIDSASSDLSFKKSSQQPNNSKIEPRLFLNILIGNNITSAFISENMCNKTSAQKVMKRMYQLCTFTAKKAINELKLMQRYFSTPYYLLKFNEITKSNSDCEQGTNTNNMLTCHKRKRDDTNLFWSITFGDCSISSFFPLDKNLINSKQKRMSLEISNVKNKQSSIKLINASQASHMQTKFYSPINNSKKDKEYREKDETTVYLDAATSISEVTQIETCSSIQNNQEALSVNIEFF